MPTNTAARLTSSKSNLLETKSAPYTSPHENEIIIKNFSVKYPFILSSDTVGEVVEIGRAVTRFEMDDRVVGHAVGIDQKHNRSAEGAFQTYTVLQAHMASPIPSTLSYESAAVLPLGLSTASCGLFQQDQLALQLPSLLPKPTGKTLLIWDGSTSVGCNAIQLAVAAGYEVITTASPKKFGFVKKLGASQVFDYNSKTVVEDLVHASKCKTVAGGLSIGQGAADACSDVLDRCKGNKFIFMATYPLPQLMPKSFVALSIVWCFISWSVSNWLKSRARHIRSKFIFGTSLIDHGVGKAVYVDFLPEAFARGTYIAAPDPHVVGTDLEHIQAGFDLQKKGMSAEKVVISL